MLETASRESGTSPSFSIEHRETSISEGFLGVNLLLAGRIAHVPAARVQWRA